MDKNIFTEWKVRIVECQDALFVSLIIWRAINPYEVEILVPDGNGFQLKRQKSLDLIENPTMKFPIHIKTEIFKALADGLSKNGIETDSQSKIQGTLEATKYHLEDLRSILKLKK